MENILSRLNNILDNNEEASEVGEEESEAPPEVVQEGAPEAGPEGAPEAAAEVSDVAAEVPEEVEEEQPAETPATAEPPAEEEPPALAEAPAEILAEAPAEAPAEALAEAPAEAAPEASEVGEEAAAEQPKKGGTVFEKLHANKELQIKNNNAVILSNNKFKGGAERSIISKIKKFINYFKGKIINLKPETKSGTEIINKLIEIYKEFKTQQKNFEKLTDKLDIKMKKIKNEITGQDYSVFTNYYNTLCGGTGTREETIISYPFNYEQFQTLFFVTSTKIFKEYILNGVKLTDQNVNLTGKLKEMYKEGGALQKLEYLLNKIYNESKAPLNKIIEILDQEEDKPSKVGKEETPEIVSEPEESQHGSAPPEEPEEQEEQVDPEEPEATCGGVDKSTLEAIKTIEHESEEETAKIKQQISDIRIKLNANPELQTALKDGNSQTLSIDNKAKYDKIWNIPEKIKRSMKGGLFGAIIRGIGSAARGAAAVARGAVDVGSRTLKTGYDIGAAGLKKGSELAHVGYDIGSAGLHKGYELGKSGYKLGKAGYELGAAGLHKGYEFGAAGLHKGYELGKAGYDIADNYILKPTAKLVEGTRKRVNKYILNPGAKLARGTRKRFNKYILEPGAKLASRTRHGLEYAGTELSKARKAIGESSVGVATGHAIGRLGTAYKWATRRKPNKDHHKGKNSRNHKKGKGSWRNTPSFGNNWFRRIPIRGPRYVREGNLKNTTNFNITDSSGVELTDNNKQVPGAVGPGAAGPGAAVPGATSVAEEESGVRGLFNTAKKRETGIGNAFTRTQRAAARKIKETRQKLITREAKKLAKKGEMLSTDKLAEFLENNKELIKSKVSKNRQTELIAISEVTMNMTAEYKKKAIDIIKKYTKETEDPEIKVYEEYLLLLLWSEKASEVRLSEKEAEADLVMIENIMKAPDIGSSI
jgi:hypothetical protein